MTQWLIVQADDDTVRHRIAEWRRENGGELSLKDLVEKYKERFKYPPPLLEDMSIEEGFSNIMLFYPVKNGIVGEPEHVTSNG